MAEVEFTLPTVQFGNVKVRATLEELGIKSLDAGAIGVSYAVFLNLLTQGFKRGSELDVEWEVGSTPADPQEAVTEAARLIKEELGATEVPEGDDYRPEVERQRIESEQAAPWDKPQVDSKPKPWETSGRQPSSPAEAVTAPTIADIDW